MSDCDNKIGAFGKAHSVLGTGYLDPQDEYLYPQDNQNKKKMGDSPISKRKFKIIARKVNRGLTKKEADERRSAQRFEAAVAAMQGLIAFPHGIKDVNGKIPADRGPELVALRAVQCADALMAKLEEK